MQHIGILNKSKFIKREIPKLYTDTERPKLVAILLVTGQR